MTEGFYEFVLGYQRLVGAYISKYYFLRHKKGDIFEDLSYISTQQYSFEHFTRPLVFSIVNLIFVYSFLSYRYLDIASIALCTYIQFGSGFFQWISIFGVYFSAKLVPDASAEESKKSRKVIDADNIETYQHTSVLDQTGFRCLVLKKSTDENSVIECGLFGISITTPPVYEALSYTWGPPSPASEQQYVLCDGKKLPVTENCISALYHLRQKYSNRLLWIDAICIDQTNIEEASQQVQIMGQIYQNAAKVIVWLGPSTPEHRLAFKYIALHLQLWRLPQSMRDWGRNHLWTKIQKRGHETMVADVSHMSWFSRVWTIQEIGLAQQGVCTIRCGNDTENYDFANAEILSMTTELNVRNAYPLNDFLYHQPTHIFRADIRGRVLQSRPLSRGTVGKLLRYLAVYDATNPRDKIYGLYGILSKLGFSMPTPDYKLSIDDVYWKSMIAIIEKEPDLAFLSLASGLDTHIPAAPSWVPDFRKTNSFMCLDGTHHAAKESLPVVTIQNRGAELQVSGTIIDRISNHVRQKVWEPPFGTREVCDGPFFGLYDPEMFYSTIRTLQAWMTIGLNEESCVSERYSNFYEATQQVATQGHLHLMNCGAKDFAEFLDLLYWNSDWYESGSASNVRKSLDQAENDPEMRTRFFDNSTYLPFVQNTESKTMCAMKAHPTISKVLHLVWAVARGNTIFETATGWLGIGANTLKEDDVLALISGMRMPVILRPVLGTGERKFMVVGTAYVHGMMNGEAWDENEKDREDLILG